MPSLIARLMVPQRDMRASPRVPKYIHNADVVVLTFAVDDASSLRHTIEVDFPNARKSMRADAFTAVLGLRADAGKEAVAWADHIGPSDPCVSLMLMSPWA